MFHHRHGARVQWTMPRMKMFSGFSLSLLSGPINLIETLRTQVLVCNWSPIRNQRHCVQFSKFDSLQCQIFFEDHFFVDNLLRESMKNGQFKVEIGSIKFSIGLVPFPHFPIRLLLIGLHSELEEEDGEVENRYSIFPQRMEWNDQNKQVYLDFWLPPFHFSQRTEWNGTGRDYRYDDQSYCSPSMGLMVERSTFTSTHSFRSLILGHRRSILMLVRL